jgi:hypothetical protein
MKNFRSEEGPGWGYKRGGSVTKLIPSCFEFNNADNMGNKKED